jgi:hypothetical protein
MTGYKEKEQLFKNLADQLQRTESSNKAVKEILDKAIKNLSTKADGRRSKRRSKKRSKKRSSKRRYV